jgi:DNA (cytosine-5)-methyltransferase 1
MDGWERPDNAHAEAGWLVPTVTAKWAKGTGGPSGDECQNLVPFAAFDSTWSGAYPISDDASVSPPVKVGSGLGIASPPAVAFARTHRASTDADADIWNEAEVAPTLNGNDTAAGAARSTVLAAYPLAMRGRADGAQLEVGEPDVYNSLRAGDGGSSRQNAVLTPDVGVRRLTPRECERLMGWPDDWTRYAADGSEIADSHRYRLCGNGVVSPVAEWIARRLLEVTG